MRDMDGLVRMATGQQGLLTTKQLRRAGVTKAGQSGLVRDTFLISVRRGVFRLAGSTVTWEQNLLAACLTAGASLVPSHRSALRIWDLRTRFDGIEVAVAYPGNRALCGVVVHRSVDLASRDVTAVKGLPVTNPARTLCDAGLIFPQTEVQRLTDHAVAIGLVTPRELIAVRRRLGIQGRNGVVWLDHAVDGLPAGAARTESGPEVALLRLLTTSGLPGPTPQHEVVANGRRYRLDLAFPDARLGIEYDGVDVHSRVDRFVEDRRRQNDLVEAGWTILRYTHADLRDRPGVIVHQIRHHLRVL
jgi:very-short-patch-repair endonuclease